ncbi:MAG: regulatory protein [Actinomycetota bacterium]|jgi:regulatory protein|nr:regulatory protein [Actinomycetota bacterium]
MARRGRRGPLVEDGAGEHRPPEPDADPYSVARAIVLRKLTAAPRTRAQLADDLVQRDVPDEVATRVLDRFTEVGLVDDEAFAQTWVRTRHLGRGLARRALAAELRQRGVADETVSEAIEAVSPDDERASAVALVDRRLAATRGLPRETRIRRLTGLLARKGYSGGLAMAVVREALDNEV